MPTEGCASSSLPLEPYYDPQRSSSYVHPKRLEVFALYFCYPLSSKPALQTDGYCTVSKDNSAVVSGTPLVPFRADRCVASANVTSLLPSLPVSVPFLPCQNGGPLRKKTLVLDLDETLVHSSFDPSQPHQFSFPVMLDGRVRQVYVSVRPGVESFLQSMSSLYEIVVFTASFHQYADAVLNRLDPRNLICSRLYREHCIPFRGQLVKDLSLLGRSLSSVVIVDNCARSFLLQKKNGIECQPFWGDEKDCELENLTHFLQYLAKKSDVRKYTNLWQGTQDLRSVPASL
ncbi:Mitochondrial import inner membrane translocase subunit TIM50 [Blastocystis sp. ATCC 50177/Nand II]|uniref:Mitochondrial import inner membrane translocase subunit TIM50 n=1 Tax=Blastocystis sp. subtype 1 (strain ATCC 50177 / NandII) TaxID=478820 RepID=A0A196SJU6_BLAHN|nr:Mitochondrial import inner membrane translocase subunit TIM50 [Blastocystis sp. ATCC 50177/Nand II]